MLSQEWYKEKLVVGLIITIVVSILFSIAAVIIACKTAKTDKAKHIWIIASACETVLIC